MGAASRRDVGTPVGRDRISLYPSFSFSLSLSLSLSLESTRSSRVIDFGFRRGVYPHRAFPPSLPEKEREREGGAGGTKESFKRSHDERHVIEPRVVLLSRCG